MRAGPCDEYTTTNCITLQQTATHCNTLQHTTTHCKLHRIATHCNTLQHTFDGVRKCLQVYATTMCERGSDCCAAGGQVNAMCIHCNTMKYTATHSNTLQTHCLRTPNTSKPTVTHSATQSADPTKIHHSQHRTHHTLQKTEIHCNTYSNNL